jgi:(R,R)-butanediol dehydrogenase/meso-butanediol dehydrogenase/diacetyl reductase
MRAAVFHEAGKPLTIETVADPRPKADEVLIEIAHAGICGSDLHMTEFPGFAQPGLILGHEFAGVVAEVGSQAAGGWKPGDRVTAVPLNICNSCEACRAGLPALCATGVFLGTSLLAQGAYAQALSARSVMVQRLPDGVSFAEGAMVEPLSVGHHAVELAELPAGASVLVMGGGPIGAAIVLFARHAGARHVMLSEPSPDRRARGLELGATAAVDPKAEDPAQAFARHAGGAPQVVFECVGAPGMVDEAVRLAGLRGRIVVAGVAFQSDQINALAAFAKEVTIRYSMAYTERNFAAVIDALARGQVDARPVHTSTVKLDELPQAFEALRNAPRECKVLIDPT